ncbi:MAG: biotin transporter BioY [Anaerolineae bacterium]
MEEKKGTYMRAERKALVRSWLVEIAAISFFAALTALTARIAIYLPFSPVPVTGQVLAVALSGLILGSRRGALSQAEYLVAGLAGLPIFAGGRSGPASLFGPTGGYLVSFVLAAFVAGFISERLRFDARLSAFVASMAAVAVIYLGGTSWLAVWLGGDLARAWELGAAPFIIVDLGKALLAASVVSGGKALFSRLRPGS